MAGVATHGADDATPARVGIIGRGALWDAVCQCLAEADRLDLVAPPDGSHDGADLPAFPERCSLIVSCDDRWRPGQQRALNAAAYQRGVPWLRAYIEFATGIVGPCIMPPEPGCATCAEARRRAAAPNPTHLAHLIRSVDDRACPPGNVAVCSTGIDVTAALVAAEVLAFLRQPERLTTRRAVLHVDPTSLRVSQHRFLPDTECPACGFRPDDTAEAACIVSDEPQPKLAAETYRVRSIVAASDHLFATFVDHELGVVHGIYTDPDSFSSTVSVRAGIDYAGEHQRELPATGRTLSFKQSQVAAIAEALERYGGQRPKGKRTVVNASYRQVRDQALDPATLGLHPPELYTQPDVRFVPYHEDLVFNWVWGYSFGRAQPMLVPEHYAYYGLHRREHRENPPFVYEISNGCALGSSLEEAIFHGIMELAERDAFLLTWYAQLPLPRIEHRSLRDPMTRLLVERFEQTTGYALHAYDATLDHGVSCVWLMAIDEANRDLTPKALCGAGADPRLETALANAVTEMGSGCHVQVRRFQQEENRQQAMRMYADPDTVREMEDHALLYSLPQAFERLRFLYDTPRVAPPLVAAEANESSSPGLDLRDDLHRLVQHYLARDIDVIVVDQTAPEHTAGGFRCVKVIMPGLLPMTFGHRLRRCTGFARLYELPHRLGYRDRRLTDEDLNPHPHPFP